MSIFDRFLKTKEEPQEAEQRAEERPFQAAGVPRGVVFESGRLSSKSVMSLLNRGGDKPKSAKELRAAAQLPLVEAIINTIILDVNSSSPDVGFERDVVPADADANTRRQLLNTILWPKDGETWWSSAQVIVENLLVLGHADIELLRRKGGRVNEAIRAAIEMGDYDNLPYLMRQAASKKGEVLGWAVYDPANIYMDMDDHGTFRNPAFYDFGRSLDTVQPDKKDAVALWDKEDFFRVAMRRDTRAAYYGSARSPVEAAWPVIDIIFHLFYRYKQELTNPISRKMVSFEIPATSELSPAQITDVVETMRADIHAGRLPVLEGLSAQVHDLGHSLSESEPLSPLDQLQIILWKIFGVGNIEMGDVESATRSTAEQQVALARRQAVGNMKRVLMNEVCGRIIGDPHSPYGMLKATLTESDLPLGRVEMMKDILIPLMERGLPVGVVVSAYFPDLWAACQEAGIVDPLALTPIELRGRPAKEETEGKVSEENPTVEEQEAQKAMIRALASVGGLREHIATG